MRLSPPPAPQPKRSSTGKWVGIGCLITIALLVVGGFITYAVVKSVLVGLMDEYTDTQPRNLPQVTMAESQAKAVCARVDTFLAALKADQAVAPLVLSGDDINALIKYHPAWNKMAGLAYVTIEGSKIKGEVSLQLDAIAKQTKGRYLNGTGVISVQLVDGRMFIFLDSLEVKGKAVPEEFMKSFRSENLAKNANTDEKSAAAIAKFESITVQDGTIRIVPKRN
jgi:hypothetical protein